MVLRLKFVAVFPIILAACATEPTYVEALQARPYPAHRAAIQRECNWIRSEIARMHSVSAASANSQYALYFQATARNNIAALEGRAANLNCTAAFSSKEIATPQDSRIQQCINACIENTDRTSTQCFDACNN